MNHHPVAHIDPHMGCACCVVGSLEKDQITRLCFLRRYIAVALGVTAEDLLGTAGGYIVEAGEKGGSGDRKRMEQMVTHLSAMFAGGEIDQEPKDAAMAALNAVYWKHKAENRERYTTKKNKGIQTDEQN